MGFPRARTFSEVYLEWVGRDAVVWIGDRMEYHTCVGGSYEVWQLADGTRTEAELAELVFGDRSASSLALVELALDELTMAGLLETGEDGSAAGISRRRAARLAAAGLIGAVGLPAVRSITAPAAADGLTPPPPPPPPTISAGNYCGPYILGVCEPGLCCCQTGSTSGLCVTPATCAANSYACFK